MLGAEVITNVTQNRVHHCERSKATRLKQIGIASVRSSLAKTYPFLWRNISYES